MPVFTDWPILPSLTHSPFTVANDYYIMTNPPRLFLILSPLSFSPLSPLSLSPSSILESACVSTLIFTLPLVIYFKSLTLCITYCVTLWNIPLCSPQLLFSSAYTHKHRSTTINIIRHFPRPLAHSFQPISLF